MDYQIALDVRIRQSEYFLPSNAGHKKCPEEEPHVGEVCEHSDMRHIRIRHARPTQNPHPEPTHLDIRTIDSTPKHSLSHCLRPDCPFPHYSSTFHCSDAAVAREPDGDDRRPAGVGGLERGGRPQGSRRAVRRDQPGRTSSSKAHHHHSATRAIDGVVVPTKAALLLRIPASRSAAITAAVRILLHLRPSSPVHRRTQH